MKFKKICFITTIKHNVGDDFVREGIIYLLSKLIDIDSVELIHKHSPITSIYGLEWLRSPLASKIFYPATKLIGARDRTLDADLLIQSGAPVYWCHKTGEHCADNEWFSPLLRDRFLKNRRSRKFLNIAGGSCQRYHSDGSEVLNCPRCKSYITEFFDASNLTLLRDSLAQKMLNFAGRSADVLPCTSLFARDRHSINPKNGSYIVVNFMENGGHYTFGQNIDTAAWRKNFITITERLTALGRVVIACHSPAEENLAKAAFPTIERFLVPNNYIEFMKFYSGARMGIVNRVHAGFMLASLGKPATIIGNDSRALMIKSLGLDSYYVEDVDKWTIDNIIFNLFSREKYYPDEAEFIRENSRIKYLEKLSQALDL